MKENPELKALWTKACEHQGTDPSSKFVVFDQSNPWADKYNNAALIAFATSERGDPATRLITTTLPGVAYKNMNGTSYHFSTDEKLVTLLENARDMGTRLVFEYGDAVTGQSWGDTETGRVGRSTGSIKIPLVIANKRSTGGPALLDNCIVRLVTASGKLPVWRHPSYKEAK